MYSNLLIPLDGSETAEQVLPYARLLTSKFGRPVELIAVTDIAEVLAYVSPDKTVAVFDMVQKGMQESEIYLQKIAGTFRGANVNCIVTKGRAGEVIIDQAVADPALLIAMATHGRSGLNRWMLGSVAEKVLHRSANPLLLIRATEHSKTNGTASLKSIVVPLDGSDLAESVLPMVTGIAKGLDLSVILFRAYNIPYSLYSYGHGYYAVDIQQLMAAMRNDVRDYLDKKAAEVRTLGVDKVSCVAAEGLSADEIIRIGRVTPESIIAMCSHGRSGIKRWALGSVAEAVVRHSDKAVLILRPAVQ
jgi:nucleotide-binding universal stress UspA family protein